MDFFAIAEDTEQQNSVKICHTKKWFRLCAYTVVLFRHGQLPKYSRSSISNRYLKGRSRKRYISSPTENNWVEPAFPVPMLPPRPSRSWRSLPNLCSAE